MTLSEVQALLVVWKAALTAAAGGKSYTIDNRQLTRHNLAEIWGMVQQLERKEAALTAAAAGSTSRAALADFNHRG